LEKLDKIIKSLVLCLVMGSIWVIQFLLIPVLFPQIFPQGNEASVCLVLPLLVVSIAGSWFFQVDLLQWIPADLLYFLLLALGNEGGLYGIGLRGIRLDGMNPIYSSELAFFTAFGFFLGLVLTQGTTSGMKKFSHRY
jgi:hypothetical protein